MRKWQNLAPPDDPGSYYDVNGVWPTPRGTYETVGFLATGTNYTATGVDTIRTAWRFKSSAATGLVKNAHYLLDASDKIWNFDVTDTGSEMTDVTGAVTFGNLKTFELAQFGSVTIAVLGSLTGALTGGDTIYTTGAGTNFAALAGAPQGQCICVCSNAVLIFNNATNKDEWYASDIGDYTNWTTGESASGQIFFPAGQITAAVEFDGAVYVFKEASIHRMRYVGGTVKWSVEKLYEGIGCGTFNQACAGSTGILFIGWAPGETGTPTTTFYWFDGTNPPVNVSQYTDITAASRIVYNPAKNMFTVTGSGVDTQWYFSPETGMWGKNTAPFSASFIPYLGDTQAGGSTSLALGGWYKSASNTLTRLTTVSHVGSGYVETAMIGQADRKILTTRATPVLRRRTDAGTQSNTMTASFFRERHDTSAASTLTLGASSDRLRFDGARSDNFVRLKYAFTDYDVEIDDIALEGVPAGKN